VIQIPGESSVVQATQAADSLILATALSPPFVCWLYPQCAQCVYTAVSFLLHSAEIIAYVRKKYLKYQQENKKRERQLFRELLLT
jgi:hypothetical protein